MAKTKKSSKPKAATTSTAPQQAAGQPPRSMMYIAIAVVAVLALVAILFLKGERDDELTAWATVNSAQLRVFITDCRTSDGALDVVPSVTRGSPPIILFRCTLADRTLKYVLQPGKK